jgi:hypothetical protein
MSGTATSVPAADIAAVVLTTLQQAPEPLSVAKLQKAIPKPYRRPPEELRRVLDELITQGKVFQFAPYNSKGHRFWSHDLEHYACGQIARALSEMAPLTKAGVFRKVKASVSGLTKGRVDELLDAMVRDGRARAFPPRIGGKSPLHHTRAFSPAIYLVPALEGYAKTLEKFASKVGPQGIAEDQLLQVARTLRDRAARIKEAAVAAVAPEASRDDAQAILDGLRQVHPGAAHGAMVSVRELRRALRERLPDKVRFDAAVLRLAREGRIDLHQFALPEALTEQQREEELVPDDQGKSYNGIVLRP